MLPSPGNFFQTYVTLGDGNISRNFSFKISEKLFQILHLFLVNKYIKNILKGKALHEVTNQLYPALYNLLFWIQEHRSFVSNSNNKDAMLSSRNYSLLKTAMSVYSGCGPFCVGLLANFAPVQACKRKNYLLFF